MDVAFALVTSIEPESVRFTGFMNGQLVLLNGGQYVDVKPSTFKEITKVQIGKYFFYLHAIYLSQWAKSPKKQSVGLYF